MSEPVIAQTLTLLALISLLLCAIAAAWLGVRRIQAREWARMDHWQPRQTREPEWKWWLV